MIRRVTLVSKVKGFTPGAVAKASLKRATEITGVDPKPGDLPLARMKRR